MSLSILRVVPLALILAPVIASTSAHAASADRLSAPNIKLSINGPEEVVFSANDKHCPGTDEFGNNLDTPDAPVRAFRQTPSNVLVFAPFLGNFVFSTRDLGHLQRASCNSALNSPKKPDPSQFSGREWLVSAYAAPTGPVFGLVHNEYWGGQYNATCRARLHGQPVWYSVCLYVSLIGAISHDNGVTFRPLSGSNAIIAAPAYPLNADMNTVGIRDPSNIFKNPNDDYVYLFAYADKYRQQSQGACLFRTQNPVTGPWQAWDGKGFNLIMGNPYKLPAHSRVPTCQPINQLPISTVLYDGAAHAFLALGNYYTIGAHRFIYYMTSRDLLHWSSPVSLMQADPPDSWKPDSGEAPIMYPSALDPDSNSRNFDTVEKSLYLYYIKLRVTDGRPTRLRDIVRRKITVSEN